ncbi:uncharacterized protein LOC117938830 isoform X1 [Etheostoma cragini]|uniref:uncharacterized protein LOC117938830 isoform X1 n=1 Tax=Etheostoma cragini TaxID=417921 RepID=UPI00155E6C74|nr:uncharacterized protein LOC117938830 isoform X1 [Etheostoma cragini]
MMDVAATCAENEDEGPVVLTGVPEMTWDELTEKEGSLPDVSEDLQTKLSSKASENKLQIQNKRKKLKLTNSLTWKEVNPPSKLNSTDDSIQIHNVVSLLPLNQSEGASEDAGSVRLQTDLSTEHSKNRVVKILQHEDISDDDPSQLATKLPTTEQFLSAGSEDPQYRYISEAESPQRESRAVETSSPAQVTAPNNTQSPFENEGYGHLQGHTQTNTVTISDEELVPKKQVSPDTETRDKAHCSYTFVETGPLYPKCGRGPFSEDETHDNGDDDDDDWLFIPMSISDLKFKSHNEDQDSPVRCVLDGGARRCDASPIYWTSPKPLPASSSQIDTFDTLESFRQAFSERRKGFGLAVAGSTPELEMDSVGKLETTENRRESVDSCETEDSCDYSSTSEHKYLTVSRMRLAPLPSETIDSEGEGDVTNMPIRQNKSLGKSCMKSIRLTNGQNIPNEADIIILDSDDKSDQNCKKTAETKGGPKTMDSQCGTVTKKCQRNRLLPVAPQHQPLHHDTLFEEVRQDACSDPSPSTETIGQLIKTKAASEHVKRKTKRRRISKEKSVVIIDSDSDTDDDSWISWHCF